MRAVELSLERPVDTEALHETLLADGQILEGPCGRDAGVKENRKHVVIEGIKDEEHMRRVLLRALAQPRLQPGAFGGRAHSCSLAQEKQRRKVGCRSNL